MGAPVFGQHGELVAAVGMAGLTVRLERNAKRLIALVVQAGEQMSRKLGYAGDYPPVNAAASRKGLGI